MFYITTDNILLELFLTFLFTYKLLYNILIICLKYSLPAYYSNKGQCIYVVSLFSPELHLFMIMISHMMVFTVVSCFWWIEKPDTLLKFWALKSSWNVLTKKNILEWVFHWIVHYAFELVFCHILLLHWNVKLLNSIIFVVTIAIVGWIGMLCFC